MPKALYPVLACFFLCWCYFYFTGARESPNVDLSCLKKSFDYRSGQAQQKKRPLVFRYEDCHFEWLNTSGSRDSVVSRSLWSQWVYSYPYCCFENFSIQSFRAKVLKHHSKWQGEAYFVFPISTFVFDAVFTLCSILFFLPSIHRQLQTATANCLWFKVTITQSTLKASRGWGKRLRN